MSDARVDALVGDLSAIRAPRGPTLNAGSWQTEAPLRMLLRGLRLWGKAELWSAVTKSPVAKRAAELARRAEE